VFGVYDFYPKIVVTHDKGWRMSKSRVWVHALLKGLALQRAGHSGEIALAGLRRQRSMRAVTPVLFALAVVTVAQKLYIHPATHDWGRQSHQEDAGILAAYNVQ
jgi:hypothetical protein